MKKLIYILIIAIIFSACKGNSFMKQRYTHFAHNSNKNSVKEKTVAKNQDIISDQKPEVLESIETSNVLASSNDNISKENLVIPSSYNPQLINASNTISKKETENIEHTKPLVKEKKVSNQKHQYAKKIIGTILKIVLWIIILAVVVGVILILGVLA